MKLPNSRKDNASEALRFPFLFLCVCRVSLWLTLMKFMHSTTCWLLEKIAYESPSHKQLLQNQHKVQVNNNYSHVQAVSVWSLCKNNAIPLGSILKYIEQQNDSDKESKLSLLKVLLEQNIMNMSVNLNALSFDFALKFKIKVHFRIFVWTIVKFTPSERYFYASHYWRMVTKWYATLILFIMLLECCELFTLFQLWLRGRDGLAVNSKDLNCSLHKFKDISDQELQIII